jgi:hypothetical protein
MSDKAKLSIADVEAMKYNELKAAAAELGLSASGTKEDLTARIKERIGAPNNAGQGDSQSGNASQAPAPLQEGVSAPKPLTQAQERAAESKAERALRTDAQKMKAHLESQRKVSIMIPFEVGENPENGKKVPFHVNLNGYAMDLPRGQYIDVPEQIAEIIKERLESEGKIGSQWRVDRDANKADALAG